MKTSKKVLSVILSIVMALSMASVAFAGVLKTDTYKSVETLIQNESLGNVAESLINSINSVKADIAGTVLRLVFSFMKNDDLAAILGETDPYTLSDKDAASVLIKWTDKLLADGTKDLTNNDTFKAVTGAIRVATFGQAKIDLSNTKNALATVYSLGGMKVVLNLLGDAKDLNVSKLKDIKSKSDLDTLYAVIAFLADNTKIIKKAVNGNISLGIDALTDAIKDPMDAMKNLHFFIKSQLYRLIDGNAEAGKFDKDANAAKGAWGTSPYADYNADQLLAAALIRLIKDNDEIVSKEETDAALKLSLYDILTTYAAPLFHNFAIDPINENLPKFISSISVTDEIKAIFKTEIPAVSDETIADLVEGAKTTGVLGQVNNILVKLAELILTPDAYAKLGLAAGGNDKLNDNLTKICRTALPLFANDTVKENLGFDFSAFTADKVASMDLKTMAVAVLKLFFKTWFGSNPAYDAQAINDATTLEQLGVLAVYYTATNSEWEWTKNIDFDFDHYKDQVFADGKIKTFETKEAEELAADMGVGIGVGALKWNKNTTHYETAMDEKPVTVLIGDIDGNGKLEAADARLALRIAVGLPNDDVATYYPEVADVVKAFGKVEAADARAILRSAVNLEPITGSKVIPSKCDWRSFVDDVSDWALNYVKGVPAAVKAKGVTTARDSYDPFGESAFNKASLVLNQLIDFSFLNGVGSDDYKLDLEKFLFTVLDKVLSFDVAGLLGIFAKNTEATNILNNTFIPSVLGVADRAVSSLFAVQ